MTELLKLTNAYKVVCGDKSSNALSHAYLIECHDKVMLREYLKTIAKLIVCDSNEVCNECRNCKLIERETHSDVSIYPGVGEKLKAQMADDITEKCLIKPLEIEKRIFIIVSFEEFEKSQNKLLKTLEEPPDNVILLLGSSNISAILPTVKSRVKKISIPEFSDSVLFDYLNDKYDDHEKLLSAIALSNGLLGSVEENYSRGDLIQVKQQAIEVLKILNASRDVAKVSNSIKDIDLKMFLSILKMCFGELLKAKNGRISRLIDKSDIDLFDKKYNMGAIIEIIEKLNGIERAMHFNANQTMVIDRVLFSILEATHKWQKL